MSVFDDWRDIIARDLNWNNGNNRRSWSERTLDPLGVYDFATKGKPLLTDRSNEIKAAAKYVGQNVVPKVIEASKGETGWKDGLGDDLLRLAGGGVKNIGRGMQALDQAGQDKSNIFGRADQQAAFLVGNALRFTNFAGEKGGDAVGWLAKETGWVDEDAARVLGMLGTDYLLTMGAGAAAKGASRLALRGVDAAKDYGKAFYGLASATGVGTGAHGAARVSSKADDAVRMIYKADEARALSPKAQASTRATVTSQTGGVQVYDNFKSHKDVVGRIPKELGGNIGTLTRIEGVPSKQFHHIFMKELAAEYVDTARKIGANADDVIELDRIAKRHGFGLGNYEDAAYYADKVPHDLGHDWAIAKGIQPTGKKLQATKAQIRSTKQIKQLYKDFEKSIVELAVPLRDEIELFQEAWDVIPSKERMKLLQLRWNREALKKTQLNSKAHKSAMNVYKKHKAKLLEQVFERRLNQKRHLENVRHLKEDDMLEEIYRLGLDKLPKDVKDEAFALVKARIEKELGKGAIVDTSKAAVAKRKAASTGMTIKRKTRKPTKAEQAKIDEDAVYGRTPWNPRGSLGS